MERVVTRSPDNSLYIVRGNVDSAVSSCGNR